jgi:hypothetical protein
MTQWQGTAGKLTVDWDAVYARAAEIDGPGGNTTQLVRAARSAALEEAAKVAEQSNMPGGSSTLIADAIRALKT